MSSSFSLVLYSTCLINKMIHYSGLCSTTIWRVFPLTSSSLSEASAPCKSTVNIKGKISLVVYFFWRFEKLYIKFCMCTAVVFLICKLFSCFYELPTTLKIIPNPSRNSFFCSWSISLKVPKREIFDRSDFPDFYTIKSSLVGDLLVKILTYYFNFWES